MEGVATKILGRATLKGVLRLSALHCNAGFEILETDFAVGANAKKGISSFLSRRTLWVLINQNSFKSFYIDCGVPQGSYMGPILFIMYVSGIFKVLKIHLPSIHAYADDIQLYLSFKPIICRHPLNMMCSEQWKLVSLTFELEWSLKDSR